MLVNKGSYAAQHGLLIGSLKIDATSNAQLSNNKATTIDTAIDRNLTVTFDWTAADADSSIIKHYVAVSVFNPIGTGIT